MTKGVFITRLLFCVGMSRSRARAVTPSSPRSLQRGFARFYRATRIDHNMPAVRVVEFLILKTPRPIAHDKSRVQSSDSPRILTPRRHRMPPARRLGSKPGDGRPLFLNSRFLAARRKRECPLGPSLVPVLLERVETRRLPPKEAARRSNAYG